MVTAYAIIDSVNQGIDSITLVIDKYIPQFFPIIVVFLILFLVYKVTLFAVRKVTNNLAIKNRKEIKRIYKYLFFFFAIIILISVFAGGLSNLGLSVGLLTAALGWALQKPITSIAGWLLIIIKKPFLVGHRIKLHDVTGDVKDITMFYTVVEDVGELTAPGEKSGIGILIPNHMFFDYSIVNYHYESEYILARVDFSITYASNLKKAEEIAIAVPRELLKDFKLIREPFTRVKFADSSVIVSSRYYVPAPKERSLRSDITREIFNRVNKTDNVEFAFPHMQIVYGMKGEKKK